jgi:hypothetical protein
MLPHLRTIALLLSALPLAAGAATPLDPPRAVALDTSASQSADFGLPGATLIVPVRQLRVRFDQELAPMVVPREMVLQGVGTPLFRVLAAGDDGILHTTACSGAVVGDDVEIAVSSLQWSAAAREATLTLAGDVALPADAYRLLACDGLLGLTGLALDGDGDGVAGGVARFDFVTGESPAQVNPTFDADVDQWQVNFGLALAAHDARDADGAAHSGSLRIASEGGARLLTADGCALTSGPSPLRYRARYRARVLSGSVRIRSIVWFGFSGDQGEPWCEGPGIWTTLDGGVRTAGDSFDVFDSGLRVSGFDGPLATIKLQLASTNGAPFEVLIDDIGLGLDHTLLFRASFE